jgi:hypothetical protein
VMARVTKVAMIFLYQWRVEVGRSGRVSYSGDADSMLQFQLERGGDRTKHYQKMKRRQRAHLGSMGSKHDMV